MEIHPSENLLKELYDRFARGDIEDAVAMCDESIDGPNPGGYLRFASKLKATVWNLSISWAFRQSVWRHEPSPATYRKRDRQALTAAGFEIARVKGGHHFLRHPDGRVTVVPVHAGEIIGPGFLLKILRDCEMTSEEFDALL